MHFLNILLYDINIVKIVFGCPDVVFLVEYIVTINWFSLFCIMVKMFLSLYQSQISLNLPETNEKLCLKRNKQKLLSIYF